MNSAVIYLKIDHELKDVLAKQAKDLGLSLAIYLRLVLAQNSKTPFNIKLERRAS